MHEISQILQTVCKEMDGYNHVRAGGNVGTAINGYLINQGLTTLARSIDRLTFALENKEMKVEVINNIPETTVNINNNIPKSPGKSLPPLNIGKDK